jgi:large subunit ribosomal protein L17
MATSLLQHERYETTIEKAKELRRVVEKLISSASSDTLPARRAAYEYLTCKDTVHKLFADIGPRYKSRNGGYTRVIRTRSRHGDAARMAFIELIPTEGAPGAGETAAKAKPAKKAAKAAKGEKKEAKAAKKTASKKSKAKSDETPEKE